MFQLLRKKQNASFYVINLTPYEYGNAIWKLFIRNRITKDEAELSLKLFENLVDIGIITILEFKDYIEAIRLSTELKVSYYDATYIATARKYKLTLVTDDNGLLVNSRIAGVNSITSEELIRRNPELFYD